MPESSEKLDLPTDEEFRAAKVAFDQGDFEPIISVMERRFDWFAQKSVNTFSRDVFVAGATSRGHVVTEQMISGARRLSQMFSDDFGRDAAEAAEFLGKLHKFLMNDEEAEEWLRKAAEVRPK